MTAKSSAAAHLAELEAQHDAHLVALRRHAVQAGSVVEDGAAELAERVAPAGEPIEPGPVPQLPS